MGKTHSKSRRRRQARVLRKGTKHSLLSEERKKTLETFRTELIERIRFSDTFLWARLRSLGVVTAVQNETYRNQPNHTQAEWLLDHIRRRTDLDYDKLCQALKETGQGHIADLLLVQDGNTVTRRYDEELIRLRKRVATHYQRIIGRIPRWPYGPGQHDVDIDELYVHGTCLDINTKQTIEDMENLFYKEEKKLIFIQGRPGSGKTTFINKSLTSWAKVVLGAEQDRSRYESCAIILLITLRDVRPGGTLTDVIRKQIYWQYPDDADKVIKFLEENPEEVLFVMDGLDEYDPSTSPVITSLIKGESYPDVQRVVTSRHTQAGGESHELVKHYTTFLEIQGFDENQITSYIYKYFVKSNEKLRFHTKSADPEDPEEIATSLESEISKKKLESLCSVPLHMNLVCIMWEAARGLCCTKTELYIKVLKFTLDMYRNKTKSPPLVDLRNLTEDHNIILSCGILALMSLMGEINRFTFTTGVGQSEEEEAVVLKAYEMGLMIRTISGEFETDNKLTFSHLSLQELLAAYAVVYSEEHMNKFLFRLNTIMLIHDYRNVIIFVGGLSESCGNLVLNHCVNIVKETKIFPTIMQCPYFNPVAWNNEEVEDPELEAPSDDLSNFIHQCVLEYKDQTMVDIKLPPNITFDLGTDQADTLLLLCSHARSKQLVKNIIIRGETLSLENTTLIFSAIEMQYITGLYLVCEAAESIEELAGYMSQMTQLRRIYVTMDGVSKDESEHLLTSFVHCSEVRELRLKNLIIDSCYKIFTSYVDKLTGLVKLRLTNISLSMIEVDSRSLVNHVFLAYLDLRNTSLTTDQIITMCGAISSLCPRLLLLVLDGNDISGAEEYIGSALAGLRTLRVLYLNECNMMTHGLRHIIENIPESLLMMDVEDNPIENITYITHNPHLLKNMQILYCRDIDTPESDIQELVEVCETYYPTLGIIHDQETFTKFEKLINKILADTEKECETRRVN